MSSVKVLAQWSDGSVSRNLVSLAGRFPSAPGAGWVPSSNNTWICNDPAAGIAEYMRRQAEYRLVADNATLVTYRVMTDAEFDVFEDRAYRDALVFDVAVKHDMGKARALKLDQIRRSRAASMVDLDAQWMKATGQKKSKEADDIEAKRQAWRDAPADPRIEAAQTVEELKAIQPPE